MKKKLPLNGQNPCYHDLQHIFCFLTFYVVVLTLWVLAAFAPMEEAELHRNIRLQRLVECKICLLTMI